MTSDDPQKPSLFNWTGYKGLGGGGRRGELIRWVGILGFKTLFSFPSPEVCFVSENDFHEEDEDYFGLVSFAGKCHSCIASLCKKNAPTLNFQGIGEDEDDFDENLK